MSARLRKNVSPGRSPPKDPENGPTPLRSRASPQKVPSPGGGAAAAAATGRQQNVRTLIIGSVMIAAIVAITVGALYGTGKIGKASPAAASQNLNPLVSEQARIKQLQDSMLVYSVCNLTDLRLAGYYNGFFFGGYYVKSSDSDGRVAVGGNAEIFEYGAGQQLPGNPCINPQYCEFELCNFSLVVEGSLKASNSRMYNGGLAFGSDNGNNLKVSDVENGCGITQTSGLIDFEAEYNYLYQISANLADLPPMSYSELKYSTYTFYLKENILTEVFSITEEDFKKTTNFVLQGVPLKGATIIINVEISSSNVAESFSAGNFGFNGFIGYENIILWNFFGYKRISLKEVGIPGSVLAVDATFEKMSGDIDGTVIGASWNILKDPVTTEIHNYKFNGSVFHRCDTPAPTPSPTTGAPTPAPTTSNPTPAPTTPCPTPNPTQSPTTGNPTPSPTTGNPTPAPTTPCPTPNPTPSPTTGNPTPAPTTPCPTPNPTPSPTTGNPTPAPTTPSPTPNPTTPCPTPGTPAPTTPRPTPSPTTPCPTPGTPAPTTPRPTPSPTTPRPTPSPTTPCPTPGTPAPTTRAPTTPCPTSGTPAPTTRAPTTPCPTKGTPAPTTPCPTKGTPAPTTPCPTKGTPAPTTPCPTKGTPAPTTPCPTKGTPAPTTSSCPAETAFAKGFRSVSFCSLGYTRWGWTNGPYSLSDNSFTANIWAGAGRCDTRKGYFAGTVKVTLGRTTSRFEFSLERGVTLTELHIYIGSDQTAGKLAPGSYGFTREDLNVTGSTVIDVPSSGKCDRDTWVIIHAVTSGKCCDEGRD